MRSLVLLVAILAFLGLGLWMWFGGEREKSPSTEPPVAPPVERTREAEVLVPAEGSATRDAEDTTPVESGARTARQFPVEEGFEVPPAEGLELVVVQGPPVEEPEFDARTLPPVANAEVILLDATVFSDSELMTLIAGGLDFDRLFAQRGRRYRTDGVGRVRVPLPGRGAMFLGRGPDLWVIQEFDDDEPPPLPLVLYPDPGVTVQVLDATEAPVMGVPVAMRSKSGGNNFDFLTVHTIAPHGTAELRHLERLSEMMDSRTYWLALSLPLVENVEVELAADELPAEPVVLRIPPTGRLEVVLRDAADEPVRAGVLVQACVLAPGEELPTDPGHATYLPDAVTTLPDEDGRAVFPFVEVAERVGILVTSTTGYAPRREVHRGPHAPGETVRIELRLQETKPVLLGRAVHADGTPHAGVLLQAKVMTTAANGKERRTDDARLRTESDGRFRFPLDTDPQDVRRRTLILEVLDDTATRPFGAALDLALTITPGLHELGDVVFRETPLLAAGHVVDEAGAPVSGADVFLSTQIIDPAGSAPRWVNAWGYRATTDSAGWFSFRGWLDAGALALLARHGDYLNAARVPTPRGVEDAVVILHGAGRIAGSVRVDEDVPPKRLAVRAFPTGEEFATAQKLLLGSFDAAGGFEIGRVPAGSWTVQVVVADVVAEVAGIEVRARETRRDPRLQDIDLRGRVHYYTLEVVDAEDRPVLRPRAAYLTGAGLPDDRSRNVWGSQGKIEILTVDGSVDVLVFADEFRSQELLGVHEDRRVVLERGYAVTLVLSDPRVVRGQDWYLTARLSPIDVGGRGRARGRTFPEATAEPVYLGSPGRYRVQLFATDRREARGRPVAIRGAGLTIDVADTWEEQRFTITVSPEEIRAALDG